MSGDGVCVVMVCVVIVCGDGVCVVSVVMVCVSVLD